MKRWQNVAIAIGVAMMIIGLGLVYVSIWTEAGQRHQPVGTRRS